MDNLFGMCKVFTIVFYKEDSVLSSMLESRTLKLHNLLNRASVNHIFPNQVTPIIWYSRLSKSHSKISGPNPRNL